jgi:hypothetical protein
MLERSELIGRQAASLKSLAERHRIPVVVTNQVTSRPTGPAAHAFQGGGADAAAGGEDGGGHLAAALGTKWAHSVNVRLVLERQGAQRFIKVGAAAAAGLLDCFRGVSRVGCVASANQFANSCQPRLH